MIRIMPAPPHPRSPRKGRPKVRKGPGGTEYRRVFRQGSSMAVTIPPACLRLLGVSRGGSVQIVPQPSGKVVIAPVRMRVGAEKELLRASREVRVLRMQVGRLRRRLASRSVRVWREAHAQGFMQATSARFLDLDALLDQVRRLVAAVEAVPEPPPSPPDPPSESWSSGGADTSGAVSPQVSHSEA